MFVTATVLFGVSHWTKSSNDYVLNMVWLGSGSRCPTTNSRT
jgi:hypothetical protein